MTASSRLRTGIRCEGRADRRSVRNRCDCGHAEIIGLQESPIEFVGLGLRSFRRLLLISPHTVNIEHSPPRSDSPIAVERFHVRVLVFVLSIHWLSSTPSESDQTIRQRSRTDVEPCHVRRNRTGAARDRKGERQWGGPIVETAGDLLTGWPFLTSITSSVSRTTSGNVSSSAMISGNLSETFVPRRLTSSARSP
jgi:hypothetical protein